MKAKGLHCIAVLVILAAVVCGGTAWALDEAILTPTNDSIVPAEEQAFSAAMSIWHRHGYAKGKDMLKTFAEKHPNSRWTAEAELHEGCYLAYLENYKDAKAIFNRLASSYKDSNIRTKATLRLANLAEREADTDNAIEYYAQSMKMNPTWDQFKYANYHARKLMMTRGSREARINCGPVALAACLNALGRTGEAEIARTIKPTADGLSMAVLEAQAKAYNIPAQCVEMTIENLKSTTMPVLAHVAPNHFIAILDIKDGRAEVEDSIQGKHEESINSLEGKWTGKALVFAQDVALTPLSFVDSLETTGGCCGQIDEDECLGDPCECSQTGSGGGSGGGGGFGGGGGCGGGCYKSAGRPTWQVNVDNLNILVKDTPIFYNPGKGPHIAFTLTYSNENSNTGIFGRGWRSPYDMKIFFLPSYIYATTTTTAAVTTGQTSISVSSTSGFPDSGAIMLIDGTSSEVMTYGSKTANSFGNITRGPSPISASSGATVDMHTPTFQVHRDNGRIETYEWNTYDQAYKPRSYTANYGYRDTIGYSNGKAVLSLRGGGKYYFRPEGGASEGRIGIIEDQVGNQVTCGYDANGCLDTVTDANSGVTDITTTGTGINERVTEITLPTGDERTATFEYIDGNLTSITDMLGDESTLVYNALAVYGPTQFSASTTTTQTVTTTNPATSNGTLSVDSTTGFLSSGKIKVNYDEEMSYTSMTANTFTGITRTNPVAASSGCSVTQVLPETDLQNDITTSSPATGGQLDVVSTAGFPSSGYIAVAGANGTEAINYTGKTSTAFTGITRGNPAYNAAVSTTAIWLCAQMPYLSEIVTPSKKTQFQYQWSQYSMQGGVAWLHEVRECGPTESYPANPTIHYYWTAYHTDETRYGDHTKRYDFSSFYDASTYVLDELNNYVVYYGYNGYRDRTSIQDASGNTTNYDYGSDGLHNMYSRTDPLYNEWTYTYYDDHSLQQEDDPYGRHVKKYTYNTKGQVTKIETQLTAGTWTTIAENNYDSNNGYRMDWSKDGRGKTTNYHYNEDGETRGFLTSVHDPDGNATLYHYDAKGRRDEVTDPSGNVTTFEYDDLDRVTKTIHGSGQNDPYTETKYTCCHKAWVQDENGKRTYYVYDAKTRPYKTIASAKSTTLSTNITTTSPADSGNLAVASVTDFPNSGKAVVLDEIISYTGRDTQNNLLTGITRGVDSTRKVAVDSGYAVGRLDTANGLDFVQATYGYDSQYLDWMISLTDALGHMTYYTYYANGKLQTTWYPDNKGEKYSYGTNNSGNNMTKKEYGTFSGTYPNQTFTVNNDLTVNYEYDGNNRLIRTYH